MLPGFPRQLIVYTLVLLGCAASSEINAQDTSLPADIREDAYALYSDLYRNANWIEPDELLAIAIDAGSSLVAKGCLTPRNREDQSLIDNFLEVNQQQHRWEAKFDFGRPYKMLDAAAQSAVDNCFMARHDPNRPKCPAPFAKISFIRYLSVPGFNRSHARALVSTSRVCGGLCGNGGMTVYRRTNRGWQKEENSFASGCIWIF